jgi:nitrate reductase molybdenum cofactor assembly chaperone NarJ/NarW
MHGHHPGLPHSAPAGWDLGAMYRIIAELLLNPAFRDEESIARNFARLGESPVRECLARFLDSPRASDVDEYTQTLELAPPCPLYFGAYIYEEPSSCRGAGASGRNQFMIELAALYEHFGVTLGDRELPDFVPVVIEFLAVSLEHPERDGIGLRKRLVDKHVHAGLAPLRKALQKYESVYDQLIEALEYTVNEDLERMADEPVWLAPEVKDTIPQRPDGAATHNLYMSGGQPR